MPVRSTAAIADSHGTLAGATGGLPAWVSAQDWQTEKSTIDSLGEKMSRASCNQNSNLCDLGYISLRNIRANYRDSQGDMSGQSDSRVWTDSHKTFSSNVLLSKA